MAEKTAWERIRDGFVSSLKGLKEGAVDILVWVLANSPYIVVWTIVLTGIVLAVKKLRKGRKVKAAPPQEESK